MSRRRRVSAVAAETSSAEVLEFRRKSHAWFTKPAAPATPVEDVKRSAVVQCRDILLRAGFSVSDRADGLTAHAPIDPAIQAAGRAAIESARATLIAAGLDASAVDRGLGEVIVSDSRAHAAAPRIELVSAADELVKPAVQRDYVSRRLGFVRGTRPAMFQATPEGGKSILLADMAVSLAVARGECWGGISLDVDGPVLYVDGEAGRDEWTLLVRRICYGRGIDPGALRGRLDYVHAGPGRFVLDAAGAESALVELVRRGGYVLGVLDTLASVVSDKLKARENDPTYSSVLYMLGSVSEATKIAWCVAHHERKPGDSDHAVERKHRARGTGAIMGALHSAWASTRRRGDVFELEHVKTNVGSRRDSFRIAIEDTGEPHPLTGDHPGLRVVAAEESELDDYIETSKLEVSRAALIATLERLGPMAKKPLVTATNGTKDDLRAALPTLIEDGTVVVRVAGQAHVCHLANEPKKGGVKK